MYRQAIVFDDRCDAGRQLAKKLLCYRSQKPVVLALPRGGVPVGFEIAMALGAPLDLVLVRKIGAPWQPEFALGAVADGEHPEVFINKDVTSQLSIATADLEEAARRELAEIERRRSLYLAGRPPVSLVDSTAIVVDDGIATGATVEVALRMVRQRGPRRLVLAVPVAPPEALAQLRGAVDDIVCLSAPPLFGAISVFYRRFTQVTDEEVIDLLRRAPSSGNGAAALDQRRPNGAAANR